MTATANAPAHIDHYIADRLDDHGAQLSAVMQFPTICMISAS